jgi:hypothetical protein
MIPPDQFEAYEAMILSDQIPAGRVCALLAENPAFAEWYRARMAARRKGEAK